MFEGGVNGRAADFLEAFGGHLLLPIKHLHDSVVGSAILVLRVSEMLYKETLGTESKLLDDFDPGVHLQQNQVR